MTQRDLHALVVLLALAACDSIPKPVLATDDVQAGAMVITRMACGSCHVIPGIEEADGHVGPPLDHFARRRTIGGVLVNTPANLALFLKAPQAYVKGNVMPDEHLTDDQARAAAAYLGTLK